MSAWNSSNRGHDGKEEEEEEGSSSSFVIKHYSHQHQLAAFHVRGWFETNMQCCACTSNISRGDVFSCVDCQFFIHKSCAEGLPKEILKHLSHPQQPHPQHPRLVLQIENPQDGSRLEFKCGSCSENCSCIAFKCEDCEFYLDPACALQMLSAVEDGARNYISHPAHEHPLGYCCIGCISSWLHKSCAELPLELTHAFHPEHPLILSEAPAEHFFCNSCHEISQWYYRNFKIYEGLAFYCAKCEFYMDIGCASLNQTLKHPRHEHHLAYSRINTTKKLYCNCCGKRCRYDFYCCVPCNFNLHFDCLPLPPNLHHSGHTWHPLQLWDKFVDRNPNDLYSDYCETIRHPDHGVYRCEECHFTAHIECMTSDHDKALAKGTITTGNERCNQLNIETASLKIKIEIMRRDLEAMEENLKASVEVLDEIESKSTEWGELGALEKKHQTIAGEHNSSVIVPEVFSELMVMNGMTKHPHHPHSLTPRMLSEKCTLKCSLCFFEFSGLAYCCEGCHYFLHRLCALTELPSHLQHPSHPHYPLTLYGRVYGCGDDVFSLDGLTAVATLRPLGVYDKDEEEKDDEEENSEGENEERGTSWHFDLCKHPLASFNVEMHLLDTCIWCDQRISGQFCGCGTCLLLFHASCARPPQLLHHPFKPSLTLTRSKSPINKCGLCNCYVESKFVYISGQEGEDDPLFLHVGCALSTSFRSGDQLAHSPDYKMHSWHPCPLVLFHVEEKNNNVRVSCELCELKISGEARGCINCRFFLHELCAEKLPEVICHFLHPNHPKLILTDTGSSVSLSAEYECHCTFCLGLTTQHNLRPRIAFQCNSCEFHLNHKCALKTLAAVEEGVASSIHHFGHDHPLFLHFSIHDDLADCVACEQSIRGLAYCCVTCKSNKLHKSCAELPMELEHAFHQQHPLALLSKAPTGYFHCEVCHKKSTGFAYYCAKCKFFLDLGCASLNLTVKHPYHEHKLAYFKENKDDHLSCYACGRRCRQDLYLCVPCDFRLHHDCMPLPPAVGLKCPQRHQLFLRDKFVDGDPNDQYCDLCEEIRNPDHGVYGCEECSCSVHIDCVVPRVKLQVEVEAIETKLEAAGIEKETEETKKSQMLVPSWGNSKPVELKGRIDVMRENIEEKKGSIEASLKKLEELEKERETECES